MFYSSEDIVTVKAYMMNNPNTRKRTPNQSKFLVDIVAFVLLAIVCAPQATGIALHEYLSVIFAVPIIIHLLLNWRWIVNVLQRFFKKLPGKTRFNQIWDIFLFILMVEVSVSGIFISEALLPALGIEITIDPFWVALHNTTANIFLVLMGVHLAMHWTWITNTFRRVALRQSSTAAVAK